MLRVNALAQVVRDGVKAIAPTLTPQVLEYLGATCAAMLEEKLGGVVRVQYAAQFWRNSGAILRNSAQFF